MNNWASILIWRIVEVHEVANGSTVAFFCKISSSQLTKINWNRTKWPWLPSGYYLRVHSNSNLIFLWLSPSPPYSLLRSRLANNLNQEFCLSLLANLQRRRDYGGAKETIREKSDLNLNEPLDNNLTVNWFIPVYDSSVFHLLYSEFHHIKLRLYILRLSYFNQSVIIKQPKPKIPTFNK